MPVYDQRWKSVWPERYVRNQIMLGGVHRVPRPLLRRRLVGVLQGRMQILQPGSRLNSRRV